MPEKLIKSSNNHYLGRFEITPPPPLADIASDNLIHETKDFIELRGSPSLVGRAIANPMSERTRGFEILYGEKAGGANVPLPALFSPLIFD